MTKNVYVAYLLWAVGGLFGAHHIYLNRPDQALLYTITLGGFWFGLWRDLYRLPSYVRYANGDSSDFSYYVKHKGKSGSDDGQDKYEKAHPYPPLSPVRLIVEWVIGYYFGYLASSVVFVDYEWAWIVYLILSVPGVTTGIWFVGQVGEQDGSWGSTLLGVGIGALLDVSSFGGSLHFRLLAGIVAFNRSRKYRTTISWKDEGKAGPCKSLGRYLGLVACFNMLFFMALFSHGQLKLEDGSAYYFRDSFDNLRNSDFWETFNSSEFYFKASSGDYNGSYKYFANTVDIQGYRSSLRVLGFKRHEDPDWSAIKSAHRKLAVQYHPDKFRGPEEDRERHQEMFIKIQTAYDTVKKEHDRRAKRESKEEL